MAKATMLKRRSDMTRRPLPECHGGRGALDWIGVLGKEDLPGRRLRYWHDNILDPGVTIGVHPHSDDEEYYYILEGRGVMILDGERFDIGPGDIAAVYPGGTHGLENTGEEPMRILVVSVG